MDDKWLYINCEHKYINERENEFIVFICKNVSKKRFLSKSKNTFHSQKVSFKVSMLIPIAKINPANILILAWFAKINPAIIYLKLINTRKICTLMHNATYYANIDKIFQAHSYMGNNSINMY